MTQCFYKRFLCLRVLQECIRLATLAQCAAICHRTSRFIAKQFAAHLAELIRIDDDDLCDFLRGLKVQHIVTPDRVFVERAQIHLDIDRRSKLLALGKALARHLAMACVIAGREARIIEFKSSRLVQLTFRQPGFYRVAQFFKDVDEAVLLEILAVGILLEVRERSDQCVFLGLMADGILKQREPVFLIERGKFARRLLCLERQLQSRAVITVFIGAPCLVEEDIHIVIGKKEILRRTIEVVCLLCKAVEPIHRAVTRPIPIEQGADGVCQIEEYHALDFLFIGWPIVDGIDTHAVHFNIGSAFCNDFTADCRTVVIVIGNLQIFLFIVVARLLFVKLTAVYSF